MTPVRFKRVRRRQLDQHPVGRPAGKAAKLLGRLRQRELLPGEAGDVAGAEHHAPRLETPERPEHVAPGDGKRLAPEQVAEHDSPSGQQLTGDRFGQLVGVKAGAIGA